MRVSRVVAIGGEVKKEVTVHPRHRGTCIRRHLPAVLFHFLGPARRLFGALNSQIDSKYPYGH